MPNPSAADLHVNQLLTELSIAFFADESQYIFDKVFPIVTSDKLSNTYRYYPRDGEMRDKAQAVAPSTAPHAHGFKVETRPFRLDGFDTIERIAWDERSNDDLAEVEQFMTRTVVSTLKRRMENEFVDKYLNQGLWGTDLQGGGNDFDSFNAANSNPTAIIRSAKLNAQRQSNQMINTIVVDPDTDAAIKENANIKLNVNGGATTSIPSIVSNRLLAELFEVDNYLVANIAQNNAKAEETPVYDFVAKKNAPNGNLLLLHVADRPSRMTPSAGYTFVYSGQEGFNEMGIRIMSDDDKKERSNWVLGDCRFLHELVAPALGVYLFDTLA